MRKIILGLIFLFYLWACTENTDTLPEENTFEFLTQTLNLPSTLFNYANPSLPNHLTIPPIQAQDNTPADNPVTDAGSTLGRVLFYDKHMSVNNTVACASCHVQTDGFSDVNTFSIGFEGGLTGRNSMGLTNARYYPNGAFFWDERAATLEEQVLMPIQDHVEMGMTLEDLVAKLGQIDYYKSLFTDAFGDEEVTSDRISKALAQFVRSMVSYQSKYDIGRATLTAGQDVGTTDFSNFTTQENLGKTIFFDPATGSCAPCHGSENFVGNVARNNGLESTIIDEGVGGVTGNNNQVGLFKVNSLRNIELTAPYMHDGRFATLEEVVEHYSSGVQNTPNLSTPLRRPNGTVRQLNLTATQKSALVAFMKTLTDMNFIQDEKFSNPFE